MKFSKIVLFAASFILASSAFAADVKKLPPELEPTQSLKTYTLPEEVMGEGNVKTKITPEGYSLSELNKTWLANVIDDYIVAIVTQRHSLVYMSKNNEMENGKMFFQVITIFSKLDSTEVTGGLPADVFDEKEPVYTVMKAVADCKENTLAINTSEYFDAENKVIKNLSTNIPQTAMKPQAKNIDGQLLKISCDQFEKEKNINPEADKNKRELIITPQGQSIKK